MRRRKHVRVFFSRKRQVFTASQDLLRKQGYGVGGKMSDSNSGLSKISDSLA